MKALSKLQLYPITVISCWLVITVNQLVIEYIYDSYDSTDVWVNFLSYLPAVLQGFFTSIMFFANDRYVRNSWYVLVFPEDSDSKPVEVDSARSDNFVANTNADDQSADSFDINDIGC